MEDDWEVTNVYVSSDFFISIVDQQLAIVESVGPAVQEMVQRSGKSPYTGVVFRYEKDDRIVAEPKLTGGYKNLVFCRNDGNYMPKSTLFNAFERILKRAGLPKLPIHSLRHTHAVLLLEAKADMKFIQERLGHGSMQITSDIYSHVSKKMDKKNTARFDEYMDSILKWFLIFRGVLGVKPLLTLNDKASPQTQMLLYQA